MAPRRRQTPSLRATRLNGDAIDDSARLQIILEDYSQGRDDERNWNTVLATLIAVAFTLIGLLAAAITQTCSFSKSRSCVNVPDYLVGAAPLLPIALLTYTQWLGTIATFRSFYLRTVEQEIRRSAGGPLSGISPVRPASYVDMMTTITSLRRGRPQTRVVVFLIVSIIIVVFGGFACYIGLHMNTITQIAMTVIYAPIVSLMVAENYAAGPGGRSMFSKTAKSYIAYRYPAGRYIPEIFTTVPSHGTRNERSLPSYLLLPRVAEWVKWVIMPGAFVVTAWATGTFRNWHQFILVWLILEYLIYEARYQWNDIRGIREDADHPESTARLRLPGGPNTRRNILASFVVGVLRLILAVCIAAAAHLLPAVALLIGLVFSTAIGYEALRAAPTNPHLSLRPTVRSAAIWIIVGLGYAIRSGTGFWLGGLLLSSLTAISGMIYFAALGIMFVLLTWVLEAASYCSTDGKDFLFPKAGLSSKPHIAILLRWTGWKVLDGTGHIPGAVEPVLKEKAGRPYAPWNVALLLAVGLGAVLGAGLTGANVNPALTVYVPVVAASLLGALLLIVSNKFMVRLATTAAIAVALVGITLPAVHGALAIVPAIPWVVAAGDYAFFRNSSYQDLMDFGPDLVSALKTTISTLALLTLRLVVGRQTWQSIGFGPRAQDRDPRSSESPGPSKFT